MNLPRYTGVDELQASMTLQEAAAKCGIPLDVQGAGKQVRLDCPFGCPGDHAGKREISVDTGNPQKVFCCHAYGCQVRGNLLTLMHGWLTRTLASGGRLKGVEFKRVRDVLAGEQTPPETSRATQQQAEQPPTEVECNIPLSQSENEKARELAALDEKFTTDVGVMPPAAAMYVRRHTCLSPAAMQKWRIGVLPANGGGDKRAWSLRGQVLYPVLAVDGQVLAWVARDPQFESKEIAFNALSQEARAAEKAPPPHKHRFPAGFSRGQELFGQQAARLKEPGYRESITRTGIIVVEGFNDVLGLDTLKVPAVAIMSNKMTAEQAEKIERFARSLAGGKVTLLFDADDAGESGAKESLWLLAQRQLDVRLAWSRRMHGGRFDGRQPETLTADEWQSAIRPTIER